MMHLCVGAASVVYGQQESAVTDSLWKVSLQEVEVVSTRATRNTPVAFTNIGKEELQKQNLGQDLPYLLSMTPSAIGSAHPNGGIANTSSGIAGADGTRCHAQQIGEVLPQVLLLEFFLTDVGKRHGSVSCGSC